MNVLDGTYGFTSGEIYTRLPFTVSRNQHCRGPFNCTPLPLVAGLNKIHLGRGRIRGPCKY